MGRLAWESPATRRDPAVCRDQDPCQPAPKTLQVARRQPGVTPCAFEASLGVGYRLGIGASAGPPTAEQDTGHRVAGVQELRERVVHVAG